MQYSDSYQYSHDIDWFIRINHRFVHVASAGGKLPIMINDRDKLRITQSQVFDLPFLFPTEEIIINTVYLNQLLFVNVEPNQGILETYLSSFINFARKGFISMDRTNINDPLDPLYHVVCSPPMQAVDLKLDFIQDIENDNIILNEGASGIPLLNIL